MLGYDSLMNYLRTMFSLVHHYKWSPEWIERMPPWEKFLHIDMLRQENQKLEDQAKQRQNKLKAMR
jgi:hypothetical protein